LEACCHKAVDVVANGYQDLSGEMSAFLTTMQLILEVYTSGTVFGEELCKLDDS
jgi:hypothetical protein